MSIFRPFRKAPKKFNYIPRYYDAQKEAREQRRRELHGTSSQSDAEEGYTPGSYIRTQREARDLRRSQQQQSQGRNRIIGIVILLVFVAVFIFVLYPRIMGLVDRAAEQKQAESAGDSIQMVLRMQGIDPAKYPDLMKAWDELDYNKQMTEGTQLNIYDDDVDIRNGRKTQ